MTRLDEAGRWFAALRRGVMTIDEQAQYEDWRREPGNRAALIGLERIWERLEGAKVQDDAAAQFQPDSPRLRALRAVQVAAVVGAVMLGVGISYSTNTQAWSALDWVNL